MFGMNAFTVLAGAAWLIVLVWSIFAFLTLRNLGRQRPLAALDERAEAEPSSIGPLVSVLVPARNEEGRVLAACVQSILDQDYVLLEVVAVNDRSTDGTGAILHEMEERDARLRVIDGAEPPAGWLGKPHALQQALDASCGDWVLATDADMIFERRAIATAVNHAIEEKLDALTLIPHVVCLSFWERVFMPTFGWFMLMALPMERINNPKRKEALGVGGFFMIERETLGRVGEYGAVRAEVAEDLRMAEVLKASGARLRIEYAPDLIETRMQTNFREIWEGFTKNLFAGAKFNLLQSALASIVILLVCVLPFFVMLVGLVALFSGERDGWLQLLVPALLIWLIQVLTFALINRAWKMPMLYALTIPLGYLLFLAILINSAVRITTGSGVTWKGRKLYERASGVRPPRGTHATASISTDQTPDLPVADE